MDEQTKGRLQLLAVALVFLGPVVLAFWFYYGGDWRPTGQAVNGELILPPLQLPDNPLRTDSDARLRHVWSLVVVAPADCGDACEKVLYETRQLRRALGRDRDRVQRVWIVENGEADLHFVMAEHSDLLIVDALASVGADIVSRIDRRSEVDIFVVDPQGNLMMRFPPDLGMRGMHTDIKHLLKVSKIG
jgi:cytochrome oxidase Cu insertion factor (SCO1/SenC/PrrC family)